MPFWVVDLILYVNIIVLVSFNFGIILRDKRSTDPHKSSS